MKTPNFDTLAIPNKGFVIHGTLGKYEGAVEWLCTPPEKRTPVSYSSAHYVIAKDGRMEQLADNNVRTWHAGLVSNPDAEAKKVIPSILGKYKNPNDLFIGIELEWFLGDYVTENQIDKCVEIIKASGIVNPVILCHKQITDYKADFQKPDGSIDYSVVERIKAKLTPSVSKEDIKKQIINLINQL